MEKKGLAAMTASTNEKNDDDYSRLYKESTRMAHELLKTAGEFYPFSCVIESSGAFTFLSPGENFAGLLDSHDTRDVFEHTVRALRSGVEQKLFHATAIVLDVWLKSYAPKVDVIGV